MILEEIKLTFSENKLAIGLAMAILFLSLILGYMLEPQLYSYLNPVVEDFTEQVQSGVIQLTFQDIFLNNLQIICYMFALGILFCFSAFILAFNGFFVGYYVATTNDFYHTALLIIPHGIFEFSSCILACAGGFVLFNFLVKIIKSIVRSDETSIKKILAAAYDDSFDKLKQALILFAISIVLMVIAGFIEVYLTIPIASIFA